MLSWLFGPRGEVPDSEVIYAIGDIHGRDDLLGRLHNTIEQEIASESKRSSATVVYLGDYIDRGPESRAVIDRLINRPIQNGTPIYLRGNHEDAILRFLDGEIGGETWLTIGGGATAKSYGVALRGEDGEAISHDLIRRRLIEALPPNHLAFLRALSMTYEAGDYLFVHAGVKPGLAIDEQDPRDLLWIRGEFLNSRRHHGKIVIHGHSSGSEVVVKPNRICVDTTAYATDRLSCLVLEGKQRRFITAEL